MAGSVSMSAIGYFFSTCSAHSRKAAKEGRTHMRHLSDVLCDSTGNDFQHCYESRMEKLARYSVQQFMYPEPRISSVAIFCVVRQA